MIATTVVDEISRMLQEGRLSQRRIALRLGVSRGTVNAIALGKRVCGSAGAAQPEDGFIAPSGLPARCPDCGGKVQMPCLLCYIRARGRRVRPAGAYPCRAHRCGTSATVSFG
jgi:hypothetical protein